jgi:hypothetical protein
MRYVPWLDIPYYATRFFHNRVHRFRSAERRVGWWGPRLADGDELLREYSLEAICAIQWKRCVVYAADALAKLPPDRVFEVVYEELVRDPVLHLSRIAAFLGMHVPSAGLAQAAEGISDRSVGKGRRNLSPRTLDDIMPLVGDTLRRYGQL